MEIFETFECSGHLMPILKLQRDSSPNFESLFSFMKDYLFLCTFLAQTIYTLLKRSPLK